MNRTGADLDKNAPEFLKDVEFILKTMEGSEDLRDKRELVQKFIEENLPEPDQDIASAFEVYLNVEKEQEIHQLIDTEQLDKDTIYHVVEEYEFSDKLPSSNALKSALTQKLKFRERKSKIATITQSIKNIVHKYKW